MPKSPGILSMKNRRIANLDSSVIVEIDIGFESNLINEIRLLINACKGDKKDRFGHIKYWKCMLALIPFILEKDITMTDVNETISQKISFSKDQIVRSLNRFADRKVLIRIGKGPYSRWKLNKALFPTLFFLCRTRKLTHIVRRQLALSVVNDSSYS